MSKGSDYDIGKYNLSQQEIDLLEQTGVLFIDEKKAQQGFYDNFKLDQIKSLSKKIGPIILD